VSFGVTEVVGLENLKMNIGVMDGRIFQYINQPLQIEIKAGRFRAGNFHTIFQGACGQAVVDNSTNYFWINASGLLQTNTTGYPVAGAHVQLGRVVTDSGHIVNIYDDRAFLGINAPVVSKGAGNPNGTVTGIFGELYQDTTSGLWYTCASDPGGTVWAVT
jgi:hypothetical protein